MMVSKGHTERSPPPVAHSSGFWQGQGTGKTSYGLMRRVVRLLADGVPARRILLISFTRTAASDLRDKVAGLGVDEQLEHVASDLKFDGLPPDEPVPAYGS
jgi:hypothetical protein